MNRVRYYSASAEVARLSGTLATTYRTKKGRFILSGKQVDRILSQQDKNDIAGLDIVEIISILGLVILKCCGEHMDFDMPIIIVYGNMSFLAISYIFAHSQYAAGDIMIHVFQHIFAHVLVVFSSVSDNKHDEITTHKQHDSADGYDGHHLDGQMHFFGQQT